MTADSWEHSQYRYAVASGPSSGCRASIEPRARRYPVSVLTVFPVGKSVGCYTLPMSKAGEDYFLNPPPGSAAERAVEFGIDLTLTLENLRLTPEERIRRLDDHIAGIAKMLATAKRLSRYQPLHGTSEPRT